MSSEYVMNILRMLIQKALRKTSEEMIKKGYSSANLWKRSWHHFPQWPSSKARRLWWFASDLSAFHLYQISANQITDENFRYWCDRRASLHNSWSKRKSMAASVGYIIMQSSMPQCNLHTHLPLFPHCFTMSRQLFMPSSSIPLSPFSIDLHDPRHAHTLIST